MKNYKRTCWLAFCLLFWGWGSALAQGYPTKPITLLVPFAAGGPTDTVARTLATAMQKQLKQSVIVENVAGAGGTVGVARAATAEPDGYTLLLYHIGMATAPALYPDLSFDPLTDFEYIGEVADVSMTITARADYPPRDFAEFLQYIRQNKNKIAFGHAGAGSASHLCGVMFMNAIQTGFRTVAYKGTGPAMNDLLGGQIDFLCDQTTNTAVQIKAGKLKAYAVTTATRVAALPDVPSAQESGLKGFEVTVWHGMYAPRGTPPAVIDKLVDALQFALTDPAVKARFADLGTTPVSTEKATPAYLRKHLAAEITKWGPILKRAEKYTD